MIKPDIAQHAARDGPRYGLDTRHVAGAIDALLGGDRDEHDRLVLSAAADMPECDVLMLAQFTMAPLAERLPTPAGRRVSSSPGSAIVNLRRVLSA